MTHYRFEHNALLSVNQFSSSRPAENRIIVIKYHPRASLQEAFDELLSSLIRTEELVNEAM